MELRFVNNLQIIITYVWNSKLNYEKVGWKNVMPYDVRMWSDNVIINTILSLDFLFNTFSIGSPIHTAILMQRCCANSPRKPKLRQKDKVATKRLQQNANKSKVQI